LPPYFFPFIHIPLHLPLYFYTPFYFPTLLINCPFWIKLPEIKIPFSAGQNYTGYYFGWEGNKGLNNRKFGQGTNWMVFLFEGFRIGWIKHSVFLWKLASCEKIRNQVLLVGKSHHWS
jgi:hypothetical protein